MPRFVVLEHAKGDARHFDLMLEHAGVLLTFSFSDFPAPGATGRSLFDHRLLYLDFEGDVGRGKGRVRRVESGNFDLLAKDAGALDVQLHGSRLVGTFRLTKSAENSWTLTAT